MNHKQHMQQLAKLLAYILEKRPDEFGLIPDEEGFVSIKELLKALAETDGWHHIRRSHINELLLSQVEAPVEIREHRIRGKTRGRLPSPRPCKEIPKVLYTCIRKKAYPVVSEQGIRPKAGTPVICTHDRQIAERIGRRKDNNPVILTVHTAKTADHGVEFLQLGENLYLADFIPAQSFTGPPLPKMPEKEAEKEKKEKMDAHRRKAQGGSYTVEAGDIDPLREKEPKSKKGKGKKKEPSWKQEQRRNRRR
ncbi:MAG: RNA 2'-phosphotransferase [Desulfobacteraceae bacterium]|nr:RNA 2'-phosphotransferase [Desulfobacteraceae bacterium]